MSCNRSAIGYQLSARKFPKKLAWYPPAETKIRLSAIISTLFHSGNDFEKALCDYLGVEKCILGNSGRALLSSLLKALWKKERETRNEVLIPGYTCYSVAASVVRAGSKINVYDLDPRSFTPDINSLRRKVSSNTLAVICQHLFGIPAEIQELMEVAREIGAYVIEDAAQGLGGTTGGHALGTMADFGFYSFGRGKPLPLGAGGAMVEKNHKTLQTIELGSNGNGYVQLGRTFLTQFMSLPSLYWLPERLPLGLGETIFDPHFSIGPMPGSMARLGELSLNELDRRNKHRQDIVKVYKSFFEELWQIENTHESAPVYNRFPLVCGPGQIPQEIRSMGVRRMYPQAILDEKTIRPFIVNQTTPTPGASEIARNLITLPTHEGITENLSKEIARKTRTLCFFARGRCESGSRFN